MPERLDLQGLKRWLERGAQLVEVLPREEYEEEHLPGAVNIPLKELDARSTQRLDRATPIVAYCWDELCDMSPRAARRLETLGFEQVADYVAGKADWLAHGLPREGKTADVPNAGELVDRNPPSCALDTPLAQVSELLSGSRYGYCLVLGEDRIVLGRVRRSALARADADAQADADAPAESAMESGPSTVRPIAAADELARRLAEQDLKTAIVTTPGGCLVGVFHREPS